MREDTDEGVPARLSAGSTLWPRMLLLCLERSDGVANEGARVWRIAVLPDSLPAEAFRSLVVALGADSQAASRSSTEHKIL